MYLTKGFSDLICFDIFPFKEIVDDLTSIESGVAPLVLISVPGKNFGALFAILNMMKGLPLSYYKDMQEDKALVFSSYDTLSESLTIVDELIKNIKPLKDRMLYLSREGHTTATDFADYLVQNNNLSFREAYKTSARLVNYAEKNKRKLDEISFEEVRKMNNKLDADVMRVFNVKNSVNLKTSYGGTSINNIKKMISKLKKELK